MAYLLNGEGVGLELFEFIDPPYEGPRSASEEEGHPTFTSRNYVNGGFFHIAFTAHDIDALCEIAIGAGGRKIGETVELGNDRALYLMDPWGNVIEILTSSFREIVEVKG